MTTNVTVSTASRENTLYPFRAVRTNMKICAVLVGSEVKDMPVSWVLKPMMAKRKLSGLQKAI